jgi:DNA invertase Pin-like site-specific DNA recombinase
VPGTTPFEQRPEFRKLLANLDRIDRVVIPKLDRLGRSASELPAVMDRLEAAGVAVVRLAQNLDTSTPVGDCCGQSSPPSRSSSATGSRSA